MKTNPIYTYKKLNFLYNIEEKYTAGIMLDGWEVKSLQEHMGDINTAHCLFSKNDFVLVNAKITPLINHSVSGTINEFKERKLLLNKSELIDIKSHLQMKGKTCVPTRLYRSNNLWKLDIAIVTGKKNYDRREDIKKKDIDRLNKRENN